MGGRGFSLFWEKGKGGGKPPPGVSIGARLPRDEIKDWLTLSTKYSNMVCSWTISCMRGSNQTNMVVLKQTCK